MTVSVRETEEKMQRRAGCMTKEAEITEMQPQTQKHPDPSEAQKRQGKEFPLEPWREGGLADTLISDFWFQELWENKFLLL